ncbi:hypothetical protein BDZ89DRAFT_1064736 [Hymenopellis radicata]|nr:hypothetical protein BDZ89DRAFT_1064736 [Hymenopellis radicata]
MQLQILRVTLFLVALTMVLLTEAVPVAEDAANSDAPILDIGCISTSPSSCY